MAEMVYNLIMREVSLDKQIRSFIFLTLLFFGAFVFVLGSAGFVPYYVDGTSPRHNRVTLAALPMLGDLVESGSRAAAVLPERIQIPSVGIDLPIVNPESRDAAVLDEALKSAAVRYVDSARLYEKGNMLIFAHSSHLPIVHNQMYRAFNNLPDVKVGDTILVSGSGKTSTYKVTIVRKTDANEELIDLSSKQGTRLTLSTCDTFGKKSSRWVVEAKLVL